MIPAYIDKIYIIFAKKTKNSIMVNKIKDILMMRIMYAITAKKSGIMLNTI